MGKIAMGQVSSEYFCFHCISYSTDWSNSSNIWDGTEGPLVIGVQSGLGPIPLEEFKRRVIHRHLQNPYAISISMLTENLNIFIYLCVNAIKRLLIPRLF
jgi:hypothetical protein